ncbi:armadillo-type protein [Collybia nuda]|uniref:Armadillo-type protein n=1 Tax=Collybia nuda TaxID=64659 RepID=A0A9P5YEZ4_9AGAR|nr:armadillo-type protein [Collybia nuda]
MEVPFISSGALNRTHYALVRKVEASNSIQAADQALSVETESIRQHFQSHLAMSTAQSREHLIILLYCFMAMSPGFVPRDVFNFALPHAVSLAEAGRSIEEKRIGYLFCVEVMPSTHELQLMLVNTIRKDLECDIIPRICLALDNIVVSSNEDLIPAIRTRLHDLVSHTSPHVRRRALLAFRTLSRHYPEFLVEIGRRVVKRLDDSNSSVVAAALAVASQIFVSKQILPQLLDLIRLSTRSGDHSALRGAFLLLSKVPPQTLLLLTRNQKSPIHYIRSLLLSRDTNEHFLFLSCLECVDPIVWAGVSPDVPAVLEGWEVERVMQFLDSSDGLIRHKTLLILNRVDLNIVGSFYSQTIQSLPTELSTKDKNEYAIRLLEVLEVQSGEDGETYARQAKALLECLEVVPPMDYPILEVAVERILLYIREAGASFRVGCATTLLTITVEPESHLGQTMMVIVSALACELCSQVAISPPSILKGLSDRLSLLVPSVQDACLLAMMRVSIECNEVPVEIVNTVANLVETSGRHIRQRCEQFINFTSQRVVLSGIVRKARSSSVRTFILLLFTLPDFLESLHNYGIRPTTPQSLPQPVVPPSRNLTSPNKLRYKAYEAPPPPPRLRPRRASSSQRSIGSSRSDALSDSGRSLSRVSSRQSAPSSDPLSRTLTPGDLALAAGSRELELLARVPSKIDTSPSFEKSAVEELSSRMDLIAFDSPFVSDPSEARTDIDEELDFEHIWNSFDETNSSRGWYKASIDSVVRSLQRLAARRLQIIVLPEISVPDFKGPERAALMLRESEEESCLWRLRCDDPQLRSDIKRLLPDE